MSSEGPDVAGFLDVRVGAESIDGPCSGRFAVVKLR
jgi:hypothetical protein